MIERIHVPETRPKRPSLPGGLVLAILLVAAAGASPAKAALVVLDDGRMLKAAGFDLRDDKVAIRLPEGGVLSLDLDRVERIVDDEVEPAPPPAVPEIPSAPTRRSVREMPGKAPLRNGPFGRLIVAAGREHKVDPSLIAAVIRAESNFSPRAVSRKGARGLMQLMPATARRLGVHRPFDPEENIRGGTAYLSKLAERFGDTEVELILAAYNAGEQAVEEYGGVPPFRETREYVRKVASYWSMLR